MGILVGARTNVTKLLGALALSAGLVASGVAGAGPGDVTTIAGGGSHNVSIYSVNGVATFGTTVYLGAWEGYIVARDTVTGRQELYAGTQGSWGYSGDGGPAVDARLGNVGVMATDSQGNLYFNENDWYTNNPTVECHIRRIDHATHVISTYAGNGCNGALGDGGDASQAGLYGITAMAFDASDNLYLATSNDSIRRIDHATHVIDTVAGSIFDDGFVDNVDPLTARFQWIDGLAFDPAGNLYVGDSGNNAIRRIDAAWTTVTTVLGDPVNGTGRGFLDGPASSAQLDLGQRYAQLAWSPDGRLVIGDSNNHRIRALSADGTTVSTLMGTGTAGNSGDGGPAVAATAEEVVQFAFDPDGGLYVAFEFHPGEDDRLRWIDPDGTVRNRTSVVAPAYDGELASTTSLEQPIDLVRSGHVLYVAEQAGHRVRRIDLDTNLMSSVAGTGMPGNSGDGGPATAAQINTPRALAIDADNGLLIAGGDARIRRVDLGTGIITTVAGTGTPCADPTSSCGDGGPALSAQFSILISLALGPHGEIIVGDSANQRVRCIGCTAPGIVSTLAGTGTPGYSPDGTPATAAQLDLPMRVIVAPDGAVVIGELVGGLVRRIDPVTGTLSTIAGVPGDVSGGGDGGPATSASIVGPAALRYDAAGDLFIGQLGGNPFTGTMTASSSIRRIDHVTGLISTIAGNGTIGFSGDGGQATSAAFSLPTAIAPDSGTHLFVADLGNGRIRRIEGTKPNLVTTMSVGTLQQGQPGTVNVTLTNTGSGYLTGPLTAAVTLPGDLAFEFGSSDTPGWTCQASGTHVTCTNPMNLAPGASTRVALHVHVSASAAPQIILAALGDSDSDVVDPSAGATVLGISIGRAPAPTTAPATTSAPATTTTAPRAVTPTTAAAAPSALASTGASSLELGRLALVLLAIGLATTAAAAQRRRSAPVGGRGALLGQHAEIGQRTHGVVQVRARRGAVERGSDVVADLAEGHTDGA